MTVKSNMATVGINFICLDAKSLAVLALSAGLVACTTGKIHGSSQPTAECEGANTESCAITNGTGAHNRTCESGVWSEWGPCTPVSCDPGYAPAGDQCLEILSSAKEITSFTILGVPGQIQANTIDLELPDGTSLTSLSPIIVHTGVSVNPPSNVAQSFVSPVIYTVTAADSSTKAYTVLVRAPHPTLPPNYFVDCAGGEDSNNGTTPEAAWKTMNPVNSHSFVPGDVIGFKKGCTWPATLRVSASGSAEEPITFTSYGDTGAKPTISGFVTISTWTPEGNGIYSASFTCESAPNMLTIDGVNTAMGRFPDTGWLTIDSFVTNTTITDAELDSSVTDWTGAEVVIRKNHWVIDRCPITNHTGPTLTYTSSSTYNARVDFGYFIQNDLRTLTSFGEWYYDSAHTKLYVYFGTESPSAHEVKVSALDENVNSLGFDYLTFDNLMFEGANRTALQINRVGGNTSDGITVRYCHIQRSGLNGIYSEYPQHAVVEYSDFRDINGTAIYFSSGGTDQKILNNTIANVFTFPGMGPNGDGGGNGVNAPGSNGLIEHNIITNIGYIPINYNGANTIVQENYIDTYCFLKDDGAGIYTFYNNNYPSEQSITGRKVLNNIILNAVGASEGTASNSHNASSANGIYVDGFSSHVLIDGNTIGYISGNAFHGNMDTDIIFTNNTVFQCASFLSFARYHNLSPEITNINFSNNVFVSTKIMPRYGIKYTVGLVSGTNPTTATELLAKIAAMGTIDHNYYYTNQECLVNINQIGDPNLVNYPYSIARWQDEFGYDSHSTVLPRIPTSYTVVSDNLVPNSAFDADIAGWDTFFHSVYDGDHLHLYWTADAGLDDGSLWFDSSMPSLSRPYAISGYLQLTAGIDHAKSYVLKLTASSSRGEKSMGANLEVASYTYWTYWFPSFFSIGSTRTDIEILINNPVQDGVYLKLYAGDDVASTYFDNLGLFEVLVDDTDEADHFELFYNSSFSENKTFTLTVPKVDVKGVAYGVGAHTLGPLASIILMDL